MNKKLKVYIDGGSRGNPGPSGIGVVVCDGKGEVRKNVSEFIGDTTNNVAEYMSLIYALQEVLILRAEEVIIYTDSELLAKQINGEYRTKDPALKILQNQVRHLLTGIRKFEIRHIDRSENKGADRLVNKAIGQESLF